MPTKLLHRCVLVLLTAVTSLVAGCSRPCSSSIVAFCAVDGNALYAVIKRKVGTVRPTISVGCSRSEDGITWKHLYIHTLTYSLTGPESRPERSGTLEAPLSEMGFGCKPGLRKLLPQSHIAKKAIMMEGNTGKVHRVEGENLPDETATQLGALGFKTTRVGFYYYADTAKGRWYLDPSPEALVVCCPQQGILKRRHIADHSAFWDSIWDVDHSRVIVLEAPFASGQAPIGLPRTAFVWRYGRDKLKTVNLLHDTPQD